jgi:peptidyl-prolyl cis-trans isomerase B (cyclophilin B)
VASKRQRQRDLERARYERRMARRVEHDSAVRKWTISAVAAFAVLAAATGGFFIFKGTSSPTAAASSTHSPSISPSTPASPSPTPSTSSPAAAVVTEPAHHCTYTANGVASKKVGFPPVKPDYKATYEATIRTNRGNIVIKLLNSKATCTVNSFVHLAAKKYFSSTHCHRLTTKGIYVLQCGDPTGTGSGGPGYEFPDENLSGAKYTAGTVAMANAGPGTNGSQFFLVYANTSLPPSYTPFGTIVSGLNIIQKVAKAGSDNSNGSGDGHPKEKVEIESVTIKKS